MGQCSTLPHAAGEANGNTNNMFNSSYHSMSQQRPDQGYSYRDTSMHSRGSRNNHGDVMMEPLVRKGTPQSPNSAAHHRQAYESVMPEVAAAVQQQQQQQQQQRQGRQAPPDSATLLRDERDGLPQPPDCAIRTRCYKLNLESDYVGSTNEDQPPHTLLGPFDGPPPPLTYSSSEDSTVVSGSDPISVAIRTAQIFRGITISKEGVILSQNARATRSNRSKGQSNSKKGEKSRQAAKIDKAKDLVEESIATGLAPGTNEKAQMVSLVIMGEYDEMRCLVREGSKKLRDAEGLPDQALLAVNRHRGAPVGQVVISPSRKRVSPYQFPSSSTNNNGMSTISGQHHHHQMQERQDSSTNLSSSKREHRQPSASTTTRMPSGAPPKLKSHPRDTRPSRSRLDHERKSRRGNGHFGANAFNPMMSDPCNNMFPPASHDGDWSSAMGLSRGFNSIWNCGQGTPRSSGTMSPVPPGSDGATTPTNTHHHTKTAKYAAAAAVATSQYQQQHQMTPQSPASPRRYQQHHNTSPRHHSSHQRIHSPHHHFEARNDSNVYHPNRVTTMHQPMERMDHQAVRAA